MQWKLSRFRTGDIIKVRTKEEILATLDERGCLDGMPFMPEMLQFCGRTFRVVAVAHKTCDTARQTYKGRRLNRTVHLAEVRCDGSAHDGCEAECNLFWKDEWLRPADNIDGHRRSDCGPRINTVQSSKTRRSESWLSSATRLQRGNETAEPRYTCQATELYKATTVLAWWDPRQYIFDAITGNRSLQEIVRGVFLAALRRLLPHVPVGYRVFEIFHDHMHSKLTGLPAPSLSGKIGPGESTPIGCLHLRAGELVRIKPKNEIERTVGTDGKNRGLSFDPEEMAPYCGQTFHVRKSVRKIIDEPTGKMVLMKQPCIMLEGVVCRGAYARERLNCPRAIPSYWREIWLERVTARYDATE
jgi:hypothetical protein